MVRGPARIFATSSDLQCKMRAKLLAEQDIHPNTVQNTQLAPIRQLRNRESESRSQ